MKNIYILIFISALIACSDKSQDKIQNGSENELNLMNTKVQGQQTIDASEPLTVSETKENIDN